jgi:hypothetical protein
MRQPVGDGISRGAAPNNEVIRVIIACILHAYLRSSFVRKGKENLFLIARAPIKW